MKRLFTRTMKKHKKGFSLMEAIISITIFVIMGTMFASFMISSVRVVNLTVDTEREREMLIEAIAASKVHGGEYKEVKISVLDTKNQPAEMSLNISYGTNTEIKKLDNKKYVMYTAPSGITYSIYLGEFPINIEESLGDGSVDKPGEGGGNAEGGNTEGGGNAEGGGATEGGTTNP